MAKQTTYEEGNELKTGSSSVQSETSFEPARLNLRKMETIQRFFKYGAGLIFLVFLGLIVVSFLKLQNINKKIHAGEQMLRDQEDSIRQNRAKIDSQNNVINASLTKIGEMFQVIDTLTRTNPSVGKELRDKIEDNVSEHGDQKLILPRIYLHISREDQRSHAAAVSKQLQANGFIVPGIEKVRPIPRSDLRYFESTSITQDDIKKITDILQNISKVSVISFHFKNHPGKIRPRHYEIWFGEDFTSFHNAERPDRR